MDPIPLIWADRKIVSKHCPQRVIALVGIGRECRLCRVKLLEERESLQASGHDPVRFYHLCSPDQLPEIVPIEGAGIVELRQESFRVECIARLPKLEDDEPADKRLVQRSSREHAEVVDVSCLVTLVTGPELLGDDLGQGQADNVRGLERQVPPLKASLSRMPRSAISCSR